MPGGNDLDGDTLYVGRAYHNGDMLVAKVIPSKQIAFVSLRGESIPKTHFELLIGDNLVWEHCYDHIIPEKAVICGNTALDQPVYIGRGHYEGSLTVGKVSSVHRALFIPWCGVERRLESYEVLTVGEKREPGWLLPVETPLPTPPPPISPPIDKVEVEDLYGEPPLYTLETKKIYPYPPEIMKPYPYPPQDIKPLQSPQTYPPAYTPMPHPPPFGLPAFATAPPYMSPAETFSPPPQQDVKPYQTCPPAYTPMPQPQPLGPPAFATKPPYMSPAETFCPPPPPYDPMPPMVKPPIGMPPLGMSPSSSQPRTYDVWANANSSYSPPNAVYAGHDTDSSTIFVCRAFHRGELIPGKAMPSRGVAYVSFAGEEISKVDFEVLVGKGYHWVHARDGIVPPGAIAAGRTSSGELLFVGRTSYCGSLTPGKVQPSHRCLYIAFGGRERRIENYEILVRKTDFYREQSMKMQY